ncbi:MAG: hypothetical protein ACFFBC_05040 [Promethearchaeota archaeon]
MNRRRSTCCILLLFIIFLSYFQFASISLIDNFSINEQGTPIHLSTEISGTKQWINNSNFDSQEFWFMASDGDSTDVDGNLAGEQANFKIIGEKWFYTNISGTPTSSDWIPTKKPGGSIYPDLFVINQYGCNATHEYWEGTSDNRFGVYGNQTRNRPSVLWRRIIEMPFNMSDYSITTADLLAVFNGSANTNVETPYDNITSSTPTPTWAEYDHVTFYVQLSDMEQKDRYLVATYIPRDLGYGDLPGNQNGESDGTIHSVGDTNMTTVPKEVLKFYLNKILEYDNTNFTVFLGIDIDVEDNYGDWDRDTYYSLLIKSCNLKFDYMKKINKVTSVSWNQICDKISSLSEYPVLVQNATINFKYKIDELWNSSISPNSEIRFLINDNKHTETVNLSTATTSFQEAKIGGFDVSNLITDDVKLSIQIYLADDFLLDQNITVSIDDVTLDIGYIIIEPDEPVKTGPDMGWLVYTLIGAVVGIVTIIGLYQTHFKYPPMVRKIRKLKKKVKKAKKIKPILVSKREEILKSSIENQKSNLDIEIIK